MNAGMRVVELVIGVITTSGVVGLARVLTAIANWLV